MSTWLKGANFSDYNGSHFFINLYYDVLSQSTANNQSTVRYYLYAGSNDGYSAYGSGANAYINGNWVASPTGIARYSNTEIGRLDVTINHNADGTGTASYSASFNSPWSGLGNASLSGSFSLPTIPRASQPSIVTSPDTTENIGNIGSTVKIYTNRKSTSFTHDITYTLYSKTSGKSDVTGTVATGVTDNCDWTIPTSFYALLVNDNEGSGLITCVTKNGSTTIGTKTVAFKCNVANSNPTFSAFTFAEQLTTSLTGSATKIIKGYNRVVVTISTSNKAVAKNSAVMKSYQATMGEVTATADYSSNANVTLTLNNVNGSNLDTLTVWAKDSRGNTTAVVKNKGTHYTIVDYTPITQTSYVVARVNNVNTATKLSFTGKVDLRNFGSVTNAIQSVTYKYRKTGETTYTTGGTITPTVDSSGNITISNVTINGDVSGQGYNQNYSYDILLEIKDKLLNTVGQVFSTTTTLGSGSPAVDIFGNSVGLGLPYDESEGGRVQMNSDIHIKNGNNWKTLFDLIYPVGSIYISTNNVNPSTLFGGTWEAFGAGRTLIGAGTGTDANSTSQTFAGGDTGGEYSHQLTISEMPAHNHKQYFYIANSLPGGIDGFLVYGNPNGANRNYGNYMSESLGGNAKHTNIQPYITVYIWKRTA